MTTRRAKGYVALGDAQSEYWKVLAERRGKRPETKGPAHVRYLRNITITMPLFETAPDMYSRHAVNKHGQPVRGNYVAPVGIQKREIGEPFGARLHVATLMLSTAMLNNFIPRAWFA